MPYEKYKKLADLIIDYGCIKWECGNTFQKLLNDEVSHEELTKVEEDAAEKLAVIIEMLLER